MRSQNGVAVVGCGHWGKNIVRNFNELGALRIVCDSSGRARNLALKIAGHAEIVESFSKVLNSGAQGVVIATPAETHYDLARQALLADKDVFVEKPLALTYEQGARLVLLAERRKRILMVGHVMEYHPGIRRLLQMVKKGDVGRIQYIYSNRLSLGRIRREENSLWSFAPHDIAIILRLVGRMPSCVTALGESYIRSHVADITVTHLLFENKIQAHIFVSWLHPFKEQRLVVVGTSGMLSFDDISKQLFFYDHPVNFKKGEISMLNARKRTIPFSREEPLKFECKTFLASMRSGKAPLTDGNSGLRVLEVLRAAQRSLVLRGRGVSLEEKRL